MDLDRLSDMVQIVFAAIKDQFITPSLSLVLLLCKDSNCFLRTVHLGREYQHHIRSIDSAARTRNDNACSELFMTPTRNTCRCHERVIHLCTPCPFSPMAVLTRALIDVVCINGYCTLVPWIDAIRGTKTPVSSSFGLTLYAFPLWRTWLMSQFHTLDNGHTTFA